MAIATSNGELALVQLRVGLDGLGLGPGLELAVTAYADREQSSEPLVVFGFPGGGYSKAYFDPPLDSSYSMARALAGAGAVFVAVDHLGVGASSRPDPGPLSREVLADANEMAVVAALDALCSRGVLREGAQPFLVGLGHSMAGGLLSLQQARHRSFAALVLLGWSAVKTMSSVELAARAGVLDDGVRSRPSDVPPGYLVRERGAAQRYCYYFDDVPRDVVEVDELAAVAFPPSVGTMNDPGVVSDAAAVIDVPLLVVMGERDLCAEPPAEVAAYPRCRDFSLFVLERSGHCHNFASTRGQLFDRVAAWSAMQQAAAVRRDEAKRKDEAR